MPNLQIHFLIPLFLTTLLISSHHQVDAWGGSVKGLVVSGSSSPFSTALAALQMQINYTFHDINLLGRAMTHSSFSEENNRALSILGTSIIEASVSFKFLSNDLDISAKALNRKISEISSVETSCAVDAMRFGLHKIIRVSPRTNSSSLSVTCGAFRAIFGAVALDSGKSDDAGNVFWRAHISTAGLSAVL
ncbi:NUCLEAR FUSION DEFECTIVE 2-like protein [Drosera capensis]